MSRKANVVDRIQFQTKTDDGRRYAAFCPANRRHGGKDVYLGVVADEENGIFYNRKQGHFRFTIENGRSYLEPGEIEYLQIMKTRGALTDAAHRKMFCLDFGDAWLLNELLARSGFRNILNETCPEESDTLLSLVAFKLLDNGANCLADHWRSGNYAKYLFPSARMESQRISEFMEKLGDEGFKRRFFDLYIPYLKKIPWLTENVLIDSTSLPNDICFDISQINNHNGVISREARLIYVVERNSGFPVFFRYVPGNTVDVSTLRVTLNILKEYGIDIAHSILDAGYSSGSNLARLLKDRIPFLIRLPDNVATKKYLKEHGGSVLDESNSLKYGNRRMFIKRDVYMVGDISCHACIAVDFARRFDEQSRYLDRRDGGKNKKKGKMLDEMGYFVLLSSDKLDTKEVMPLYYMRQNIEQLFDFAKNDVSLLPLRVNKTETFRGHLLLSFIATVALLTVRQQLKTRKKLADIPPSAALKNMRSIKCEVFPKTLVITEGNKYANLILKELNCEMPETVQIL